MLNGAAATFAKAQVGLAKVATHTWMGHPVQCWRLLAAVTVVTP